MTMDGGSSPKDVFSSHELNPQQIRDGIVAIRDLYADAHSRYDINNGEFVLARAEVGGAIDAVNLELKTFTEYSDDETDVVRGFLEGRLNLAKGIDFVTQDKAEAIANQIKNRGLEAQIRSTSNWRRIFITDRSSGKHTEMILNLGYPDAESARQAKAPNPLGALIVPIDKNQSLPLEGKMSGEWALAEKATRAVGVLGKVVSAIDAAYEQPKAILWESPIPPGGISYDEKGRVFGKNGVTVGKVTT